MDNEIDNSRVALKIVFILSFLLVVMDFLEIYFSFLHLKAASLKFEFYVYENCIKFHILSQLVYTFFATFAGLSAFIMSLGLLIDYEYFSSKLLDTFMFWNYMFFGPYLLTACILGYINFGSVAFNCDPRDITQKYINFTTLLSLIICFLLSIFITMLYSFLFAIKKMFLSITNRDGGWKFLGRMFWTYVFTRTNFPILSTNEELSILNEESLLNEGLLNHNQNDINFHYRRSENSEELINNISRNRLNYRRNRNIYPISE